MAESDPNQKTPLERIHDLSNRQELDAVLPGVTGEIIEAVAGYMDDMLDEVGPAVVGLVDQLDHPSARVLGKEFFDETYGYLGRLRGLRDRINALFEQQMTDRAKQVAQLEAEVLNAPPPVPAQAPPAAPENAATKTQPGTDTGGEGRTLADGEPPPAAGQGPPSTGGDSAPTGAGDQSGVGGEGPTTSA
jgi:hypothetical protein